jgi:hypothetical protein
MNDQHLMLTRAHLKYMSQVAAAVGTRDLHPLHAKRIVLMPFDLALHMTLRYPWLWYPKVMMDIGAYCHSGRQANLRVTALPTWTLS